MKKYARIFYALLIPVIALVVSCDLVESEIPSTGTGQVVISITDAPFPLKEVTHVYLNIDKVEMRIAGGLCTGENGETIGEDDKVKKEKKDKKDKGHDYSNFDCDSGFVTVFETENPRQIDVLKLQNGVTEILAEAEIPVGKYDMIRLRVVDAKVVTPEEEFPLKVPSGNTSGLKIKLDSILIVTEGEEIAEILLDVDLSRSFTALRHGNGKKGFKGFIFKPVIRASNHKYSGSISGTVFEDKSTPVENAEIKVLHADTLFASALTDSLGKYKIIGLKMGTYALTAEKESYKKVTVDRISIWKKSDVKQNIQLVKQ